MLTKKDFVELAKIIAGITDIDDRTKAARLISALCIRSNPRFDEVKFLKACGVD